MGAYMSHFTDKHWFLYMFAMLWCAQVWFSLWLILLLIHSTSCIWSLMFVATFENSAIMPSNTCFCPIFFLFSFWNHNYIPTKGWRRPKGNSFRLNCLCAFHPISSVSLGGPHTFRSPYFRAESSYFQINTKLPLKVCFSGKDSKYNRPFSFLPHGETAF